MDFLLEIYEVLKGFNAVAVVVRLLLTVVVGGIIGSERGRHGSAAGLRTHILVCLGSALTALTGFYLIYELGISGDPGRISAQVISGIGFLGAGMILVKNTTVITGLTTAAGMWATAAMGIAIGYGFYLGAFIGMLACVFTSTVLHKTERNRKRSSSIYIEINDAKNAGKIVELVRAVTQQDAALEVVPLKSSISGNIGLYVAVAVADDDALCEMRERIENVDGVCFAITE